MPNAFNPYQMPAAAAATAAQAQPQAPQQPQCNVIWVNSMDDVLNHPVAPNTQLYFAERENPVFWVRETDGNGKVKNPLHRLMYSNEDVPFGPEANFVTKDEHKALFDLVSSMSQRVEELYASLT